MAETYKTRNELNSSFMLEIFCEITTHYHLRNNNEFSQTTARSVSNGTESIQFSDPQLWQTLPPSIRNLESLRQFKKGLEISTEETAYANYAAFLFGICTSYKNIFLGIFL